MHDVIYHSRPRFFCCFPVSWEALQKVKRTIRCDAWGYQDDHLLAIFPFVLGTGPIINVHRVLIPLPLLGEIGCVAECGTLAHPRALLVLLGALMLLLNIAERALPGLFVLL